MPIGLRSARQTSRPEVIDDNCDASLGKFGDGAGEGNEPTRLQADFEPPHNFPTNNREHCPALFERREPELDEARVVGQGFDQTVARRLVDGGENGLVVEEAAVTGAIGAQRRGGEPMRRNERENRRLV